MAWLGAAIGAGASLIGNIFGASSTNKTNANNLKINQMNNEFNERMMQKQMDYNTMMYEKQNAYNTPEAQRQRLEQAGFNPYLMMNSGNAGVSSSAGSTSAASAAGAAPQQAFHPDFQGIPQSILMAEQGNLLKAQTHAQITDNQTRALKNMQEIADTIASTKSKAIKNKLMSVELSYADQMQMEQLRNRQLQNDKILREVLLMDKNLSIFDEQTRLSFAQQAANILLTNQQARASKQQTIHEVQKMIETTARIRGLKISNEVARRTADSLVEKAFQESVPQNLWGTISRGYRDIGRKTGLW